MAGDCFANFMSLRGRRIVEGAGTRWYSNKMRIYMSIPYHEVCEPQDGELQQLMRKARLVGFRFPSRLRSGLPSGIYICRHKPYTFSSVQPRIRTQIRRGIERCEIRAIQPDELLHQGLQCNIDTMQRQSRFDSEFGDPRSWRRIVHAVEQCHGIGAVGAFVDSKLAAYAITCCEDGWLHILHQMSRTDLLGNYPNHALTYTLTKSALEDETINAVCFGLVGLSSGDGLTEYKLRMGYEIIEQNSAFVLHPLLDRTLNSPACLNGIDWLNKRRPQHQALKQIRSVLDGARMSRAGASVASQVLCGEAQK